MTSYLERIYNEIINRELSEVKPYIESSFLNKSDFGELITELILSFKHTYAEEILKTKRFKDNCNCETQFHEPLIITMITAIQAIYESKEISDLRKLNFKKSIINIVLNKDCNLNWNVADENANNPLHFILSMYEFFTSDELNTLINFTIEKGINPLNRNSLGYNALDITAFMEVENDVKSSILNKLAIFSDKFIMEVNDNIYVEEVAN